MTDDSYALRWARMILARFPDLEAPRQSRAQLKNDLSIEIRTAILEAMRDQRYACIEAFRALPLTPLLDGTAGRSDDAIEAAIHNATV